MLDCNETSLRPLSAAGNEFGWSLNSMRRLNHMEKIFLTMWKSLIIFGDQALALTICNFQLESFYVRVVFYGIYSMKDAAVCLILLYPFLAFFLEKYVEAKENREGDKKGG